MAKKYNVTITQTAQSDLAEIWDYIASDSTSAATHFVSQLEEKLVLLEKFPKRCPLIEELSPNPLEYRMLIIGHYNVIFRIKNQTVTILRIIHGSRLLNLGE